MLDKKVKSKGKVKVSVAILITRKISNRHFEVYMFVECRFHMSKWVF